MASPHLNDEATVERLVNDNMALARAMAMKYKQESDHDECFSAAMEGLLRAAREFDPTNGCSFGTYAAMRMKWLIYKVPLALLRVKRGGDGGKNHHHHVHLDEPLEEGGQTMLGLVDDPHATTSFEQLLSQDNAATIRRVLPILQGRDLLIVQMRHGLGAFDRAHTLAEVADRLGLTRERIRQIEAVVMDRLRWKLANLSRCPGEPAAERARHRRQLGMSSTKQIFKIAAAKLARKGEDGNCKCGKAWGHRGRCYKAPVEMAA